MSNTSSTSPHILALDYGRRRVGVAGSRKDVSVAFGITTLTINSVDHLLQQLEPLLAEYSPAEIVLGFPVTLGNRAGNLSVEVLNLAQRLEERGLRILLVDEALTSRQAATLLQKRRRRSTKEDVDRLAAAILLQDYLDGKLPPLTREEIEHLQNKS